MVTKSVRRLKTGKKYSNKKKKNVKKTKRKSLSKTNKKRHSLKNKKTNVMKGGGGETKRGEPIYEVIEHKEVIKQKAPPHGDANDYVSSDNIHNININQKLEKMEKVLKSFIEEHNRKFTKQFEKNDKVLISSNHTYIQKIKDIENKIDNLETKIDKKINSEVVPLDLNNLLQFKPNKNNK